MRTVLLSRLWVRILLMSFVFFFFFFFFFCFLFGVVFHVINFIIDEVMERVKRLNAPAYNAYPQITKMNKHSTIRTESKMKKRKEKNKDNN